jgi:hypothetical protein
VASEPATPFDNVESAHEYFRLLSEALLEAKRDVEGDIAAPANANAPRRLEALRLAMFKLERLEQHVIASRRLLNDLRTLRRLLLQERGQAAESRSQ